MTEYIVDSFAWVEYFDGSPKGRRLQRLFQDRRNMFFTVIPCLAEIAGWARKKEEDFLRLNRIINANSMILDLSEKEWILAGEERFMQRKKRPNFGLIDACILVKQARQNCKIITGDRHFKGMRNVIFLQ